MPDRDRALAPQLRVTVGASAILFSESTRSWSPSAIPFHRAPGPLVALESAILFYRAPLVALESRVSPTLSSLRVECRPDLGSITDTVTHTAAGTVLQLSESIPVPMQHSLSQPELFYSSRQLSPVEAKRAIIAAAKRHQPCLSIALCSASGPHATVTAAALTRSAAHRVAPSNTGMLPLESTPAPVAGSCTF